MSDPPQQCYPRSASAPGEVELGSKPAMASQSTTAQPVVSRGIRGPDYLAPSGKVALAGKLPRSPGQG